MHLVWVVVCHLAFCLPLCVLLCSLQRSFFKNLLPWAGVVDTHPLSFYFSHMCKIPPRNLVCPCGFCLQQISLVRVWPSKSTPNLETPMCKCIVTEDWCCMHLPYPVWSSLNGPFISTLFSSCVEHGCWVSSCGKKHTKWHHITALSQDTGIATSFLQPNRDLKGFCGSLQHVLFWP